MPFEVVTTWADEQVRGRKEDHYTFETRAEAEEYATERLTDQDQEKVVIIDTDSGEETAFEHKVESDDVNEPPAPEPPPQYQPPAPPAPEPAPEPPVGEPEPPQPAAA